MKKGILTSALILFTTTIVSAADNPFGEVAGRLSGRIFSSILYFGIAAMVLGVLLALGWWFFIYKRKFDIIIKVNSRRANDKQKIFFDKAAIIYDRKAKEKFLRFWSMKIELPLPTFNVIQTSSKGDYIELFRTAEDRFFFVLPPKVQETYHVKEGTKLFPIARYTSNLIDPDMAFWSTKRKDKNRSMFDPEKLWMKILPYLPQLIVGVLAIFILWILMNSLPEILSQLSELAGVLADSRRADIISSGLSWILI